MGAQPGEEAKQDTIEEQDCRQREGQPQSRRLIKRLLLTTPAWSGVEQSICQSLFHFAMGIVQQNSLLVPKPPHDCVPRLHAYPRRREHAQRMPHSLGIVVVASLPGLQRLLHAARTGRRATERPRLGEDVFVQGRIFARRDGISQGIAQDGVWPGGRTGGRRESLSARRRRCWCW